jgi:hypothetical protein
METRTCRECGKEITGKAAFCSQAHQKAYWRRNAKVIDNVAEVEKVVESLPANSANWHEEETRKQSSFEEIEKNADAQWCRMVRLKNGNHPMAVRHFGKFKSTKDAYKALNGNLDLRLKPGDEEMVEFYVASHAEFLKHWDEAHDELVKAAGEGIKMKGVHWPGGEF